MRAWERVGVPSTFCGRCGRELLKGESVLVITRPRGTAKPLRFVRCDRCEGPAPPDLPPILEHAGIMPTPLTRLRPTLPLGMPLADYRARQSGEREPGEDG